ncbi:hypothetical protein [Azonexus hydrophilus]|uniref:Uncharacterized protein n=1 Tax=Azonexus hydrophilus TaxID=418702 RepID=A0ABZ2XBQ0_9RHOO
MIKTTRLATAALVSLAIIPAAQAVSSSDKRDIAQAINKKLAPVGCARIADGILDWEAIATEASSHPHKLMETLAKPDVALFEKIDMSAVGSKKISYLVNSKTVDEQEFGKRAKKGTVQVWKITPKGAATLDASCGIRYGKPKVLEAAIVPIASAKNSRVTYMQLTWTVEDTALARAVFSGLGTQIDKPWKQLITLEDKGKGWEVLSTK